MKLNKPKKSVLLMIVILIFLYGILIPIIPLGKFLFSEAKIVKLYPYNLYLLKELSNEEGPNFDEYMKKNGWIYSKEIEGGWIYIKENSKKYIGRYDLITVIIDKYNVKVWHEMYTKLNCSKFTFYIIFFCYMLPAFWFIIFIIRANIKKSN